MDRPGTRHRSLLDTTTINAANAAIYFADTFYAAARGGYGLEPSAFGVILVFRHFSTPFGLNDAMWAKYGAIIAGQAEDGGRAGHPCGEAEPDAVRARRRRTEARRQGRGQAGQGRRPRDARIACGQGVRFVVCATATEELAGQLARSLGGDAKAVRAELGANLVPGAVMVPAGIVAVNRAQERGYAFVNIAT